MQDKLTPPEGYIVRYNNQTGQPYFIKKEDFERRERALLDAAACARPNAEDVRLPENGSSSISASSDKISVEEGGERGASVASQPETATASKAEHPDPGYTPTASGFSSPTASVAPVESAPGTPAAPSGTAPVTRYGAYTYTPGEMLPGAAAALRGGQDVAASRRTTDGPAAAGGTGAPSFTPSRVNPPGPAVAASPAPFACAPAPTTAFAPFASSAQAPTPSQDTEVVRDVYTAGSFAGFFTRLAAYLVDWALAGLLSLLGGWMFGGILRSLGADTSAYVLFNITAVQIFRYLLFTAYFVVLTALTGCTAGKRLLRIQVVRADGEKIGWWTALYRETIGRYLTSLLCIGYLVLAFDGRHRGFHDMLCDTRVVFAEKAEISQAATNAR